MQFVQSSLFPDSKSFLVISLPFTAIAIPEKVFVFFHRYLLNDTCFEFSFKRFCFDSFIQRTNR